MSFSGRKLYVGRVLVIGNWVCSVGRVLAVGNPKLGTYVGRVLLVGNWVCWKSFSGRKLVMLEEF